VSAIKQNYFELFAIPQTYQIDIERLAESYRALQTTWHPDRFAGASEQEKLQAVQMSSYLNQAFDTLKAPLPRAGYLLTLQNLDTEKVTQQDLGMDLLMEQMQLREALEDLPAGETALEALEALKAEVEAKINQCQIKFADEYGKSLYQEAKKSFHELQFLVKLFNEIEIVEEQQLGY